MAVSVSIIVPEDRLREKLTRLLARQGEYHCLAVRSNELEASRKSREPRPQMALIDLQREDRAGVLCVQALKASNPEIQILLLAGENDGELILAGLAAGAKGCIPRNWPAKETLAALRAVRAGDSLLPPAVAGQLVRFLQNPPRPEGVEGLLSPREGEVLRALASGCAYKEMADRLGLRLDTIRTYIRRLYAKLQVHSRGEAVARFIGEGRLRTG